MGYTGNIAFRVFTNKDEQIPEHEPIYTFSSRLRWRNLRDH